MGDELENLLFLIEEYEKLKKEDENEKQLIGNRDEITLRKRLYQLQKENKELKHLVIDVEGYNKEIKLLKQQLNEVPPAIVHTPLPQLLRFVDEMKMKLESL